MDEGNLVGSVIQDPFERLVIRVAACMIAEPKFYESAEKRVSEIVANLNEVLPLDPEFICKLAYYSRNELNLRSTSNFLAAWAAVHKECRPYLNEFFPFIINLPSDLIDFVEKYQVLKGNSEKAKFSTYLQSLIKKKFCDFSIYQLGKYCSEGKRKRALMAEKKEKNKFSMKKLVRACHIKRPALTVCSILGKKYPSTLEEFQSSSLSAETEFDPSLAGKRMKIKTPVTWETTLSSQGNKAESWEFLIKTNKLPFMATLRNIRNLLITGVDNETHAKVCEKLSNPDVISNSRLFPFRFLSAYESIKIDLEELEKIKTDPEYQPKARTGRTALKYKPKKKIPKILPTPETLAAYKAGLEEAVKLATALNVSPIRGHTVIFCDASGSMMCKISSGAMGSVRTCMDLGYLFGLMLRHVCESSEILLVSSPNPPKTPKC